MLLTLTKIESSLEYKLESESNIRFVLLLYNLLPPTLLLPLSTLSPINLSLPYNISKHDLNLEQVV